MANLRKIAAYSAISGIAAGSAAIGACNIQARRFEPSRLPCADLSLPESVSKKPLEETLCISVSGEQPKTVGIETREISGGRIAHTLFLGWNYDGITEWARKPYPDVEPITLITDKEMKPLAIQVRSHWRVGAYDFESCKAPSGKVAIAISDSFHTPVIAGCPAVVTDPAAKGGINTAVFKTVVEYGKGVAQTSLDRYGTAAFSPLAPAKENSVPGPDHKARTQPLFSE